jgi:hypothetical protein
VCVYICIFLTSCVCYMVGHLSRKATKRNPGAKHHYISSPQQDRPLDYFHPSQQHTFYVSTDFTQFT